MTTWETITSAPKDGEEVLLWRNDWPCPVVAYWCDEYDTPFWCPSETVLADIMGEIEEPSHWLPFPLPPTLAQTDERKTE